MMQDDRRKVLESIALIKSVAEDDSSEESHLKNLLVLPEYGRLQEENRFLILGEHGAGKTQVFKALTQTADGFSKLTCGQPQQIGPSVANTQVITGYNLGRIFPSQDILNMYAEDKKARAYWAGSLLIILMYMSQPELGFQEMALHCLPVEERTRFEALNNIKTPSLWLQYIQENPEIWENILDQFDEQLCWQNRRIVIAYDALDHITTKYTDLFPFLRALLSFWHTHSRRWQRLHCKIFLRSDLYQSQMLAFPDSSKMSNCIIRLTWNPASLYRLLIKRIANAGCPETVAYLRRIPGLISADPDSALGYIPTEQSEKIEAFVEMMLGKYMGNSPKQGRSYSWAPNHLQDANGTLSPWSFLTCFIEAAKGMLEHPEEMDHLQSWQIILPARMQNTLFIVSDGRISELQEEYPWLAELRRALNGLTMPMDQQEFINHFDVEFWNEENKRMLPEHTPQRIFSVLQELGIVMIVSSGLVDVPDLYLHGLRMRRKNRLRQPKRE